MESRGVVRHAGEGDTVVGAAAASGAEKVEKLADVLRTAGIEVATADDMQRLVWSKALVNAGINPLTAILGCPNGAIPDDPEAMALVESLLEEGVYVATRKGIDLDEATLIDKVVDVCLRTAVNHSSMLQDVMKGRRTEIDALNGAIASEGRRLGVETPVNRTVTSIVHMLERHRMK